MRCVGSAVARWVLTSSLAAGFVGTSIGRTWADDSVFEKPVRLQADGKIIDTGELLGHSGPCLADVDGDGLRDLVVGDFSGKFHVYRNLGTNNQPKFGPPTDLMAGGVPAKVFIYCCIGSSPQFFDIDGDGHLDLISGSYDPGACYLFRGLGNGKYAARETIVDKAGNVILRYPQQEEVGGSFGSWPTMVDWNGDGRLDLVIGGFDGGIRVWLNEGTPQRPQFAAKSLRVQADGKDLMVPGGHAAPVIVDWDGDGRWDILSGCDRGSVLWYRNIGKPGAPRFAAGETLVPEHAGSGFDEFLDLRAEPVPGIRSQIAAVDYDGDGRIDLLLGDFCSTVSPRPDLSPKQRAEMFTTLAQENAANATLRQNLEDLRLDIKRRYPGEKFTSHASEAEFEKRYKAMNESQQHKALEAKVKQLDAILPRYLSKPNGHSIDGLATDHGYVWLFRRKPFVPSTARVGVAAGSLATTADVPEERPTRRKPVVAAASVVPQRARPGETVTLTLDIRIGAGWHINAVSSSSETAIPTRVDLKLPSGIDTAAEWKLPEPDVAERARGPVYRGEITFRRTLKVTETATVGSFEVICDLAYQACDENQCLRPTTIKLKAPVEVVSP
ncbi:MAG TPA: FG-GAP-like repeat-containing protein [Planctomycetaceae bacterium]|nr:FG-GAP-like repeat-containing protein [Planctomycetaceae bacterium]